MLNLSQLALESCELSFFEKVKRLMDPDIYLAEGINDYLEGVLSVKPAYYKKFLCGDRVYISIMDVKLETLKQKKREIPNWFLISDESGADVVYWDYDSSLFPALHSFEELQEKQGLRDGDWVYDVFIRYLIDYKFPSMVEVRKYNSSKREFEKASILDKIRDFVPELSLT